MNFNHVMVDLETLSSREDAAIVSIGAVRFDLENFRVADAGTNFPFSSLSAERQPRWTNFYEVVDISGLDEQFRVDGDTIKWWMGQSDEARAVFSGGQHKSMRHVLENLQYFIEDIPYTYMWGNGSTFDNMILRHAYRVCELVYPVDHKHDLCYRTIKTLFPHEHTRTGTHHNALDDARYQAEKLCEIMRQFKPEKEQNTCESQG